MRNPPIPFYYIYAGSHLIGDVVLTQEWSSDISVHYNLFLCLRHFHELKIVYETRPYGGIFQQFSKPEGKQNQSDYSVMMSVTHATTCRNSSPPENMVNTQVQAEICSTELQDWAT